jgi:hypothetical protein
MATASSTRSWTSSTRSAFINECKQAATDNKIELKLYRGEDRRVSNFFMGFQTLKQAKLALHVAKQLTADIKTDFCEETMPDKDDYKALYAQNKEFMASASYKFTETGIIIQDGPVNLYSITQNVEPEFGKYAKRFDKETKMRTYVCSAEVAKQIKAAYEKLGVCLTEGLCAQLNTQPVTTAAARVISTLPDSDEEQA